MSIINNGLLLAAEAAAAPITGISRSLRFNSADSAFLSRTPASAGNRKTWTFSTWVKRSGSGSRMDVLSTNVATSGNYLSLQFSSGNAISLGYYNGEIFTTSAVYRDFSAWMHVVLALDTTLATAADRVKLYVNGSRVTTFSTDNISSVLTQNSDQGINAVQSHSIGRNDNGANVYFDGYLADVYLIDGQALDPTSFGEFDTNGVWQPIAYSGSYGTNGFRLTFSDNSGTTSTTLGKDAAGSNNWTPNNFSVAAGSGNDSLVDVPQNGDQTDTGAGGEVRGNYATWNPLASGATLANGNLDVSGSTAARGTIGVTSGKWYYEFTLSTNVGANPNLNVGVIRTNATSSSFTYDLGNALGASSGDVIGVALDVDAGRAWIAKNGTWVGSGNPAGNTNPTISSITLNNDSLTFFNGPFNSVSYSANFGARPFAYTAPSGFKALCTTNLPTPTIADGSTVMDVVTYTGNGSTNTISGLGFSPDFVWVKDRSAANYHTLQDIVRGATKDLYSNVTDAEGTQAQSINAFNSDGFSVGTAGWVNASSNSYVAWTWDAGSSTVTNTSGSISSQVRANASAGFSIVSAPISSSGGSIGHGLNVSPGLIIVKNRGTGGTNWVAWHSSLGTNDYLLLNSTDAKATSANLFNGVSSSTFTVGSGFAASTLDFICYCFAPVASYSSFGSYVGNGSSDGPFVYTGHRSRWLLIKASSFTQGWALFDTAREPSNDTVMSFLQPNTSNAETGITTNIDILSNGFKPRANDGNHNSSGQTYIFASFAEHPFQTARAR